MELMEVEQREKLYKESFGKRTAQEMLYRAITWKDDITLLAGPSIDMPFEHTRYVRGQKGKFISWENDPVNIHIQQKWFKHLTPSKARRVELNFGDVTDAEPTSIMELDLEHGIRKESQTLKTLFIAQRDMIQGPKAFMFHVTGRDIGKVDEILIPYINDLLGTNISIYSKNLLRINGQYTQGIEYSLCGDMGRHSIKIVGYGDRGTMISVLILHGDAPDSTNNTES